MARRFRSINAGKFQIFSAENNFLIISDRSFHIRSQFIWNQKDGKRQSHELGKYFRRRYNEILGAGYSVNDIYVQSTDVDRAIMSAQTNLAALYRPNNDEIWDDDLANWQPIPVHTIPAEFDFTLYGKRKCPKYKAAFRKYVKQSDEIQRILADNRDLFEYWSEKCGLKLKR